MKDIHYQSHIDILRAIAVLLVIFNHLGMSFFSGGFIGVDIFFVISGYLITQNIIKEKQATDFFSFKNFYTRRIIRLAPSFFTVILISSLFFLLIMTTEEIIDYLKTVIASLTLTSNIYYTSLLNSYFSITAKSTPLLHIWSLSLEEQFYLFWPVFFIALYKLASRIKVFSILVLIAASLIISYKMTQSMPIASYYLLPSRIFEFGIGALLCFLPQIKIRKIQSIFYSLIALGGLITASYLLNENSIFPSYTALIPCLLAALFIYTGQNLSNKYSKLIEYLGKISYPMYLWHWPVIVYLSLLSISLTPYIQVLILLITIALSVLSYEFIEKTIKKNAKKSPTPIKIYFILPFVLILSACAIKLSYVSFHITPNNTEEYNIPRPIKCIDQSQHPREDCYFGDKDQKNITIFLVGDSHANAQSGFIDHLAKNAQLSGYEMTFSSTAFLPHINRSIYNQQLKEIKLIENFKNINNDILSTIQILKPKIVVMGGYFPHNWDRSIYSTDVLPNATSKEVFIQGLSNAILEINKIGAKPMLVNDNPILADIDINCNLRKSADQCYFDKIKYLSDFQEWRSVLAVVKRKHPELTIIDFNDIICNESKCYSSLNNIPLYRDNQHMTYRGSQEIAIEYLKTQKNPFSSIQIQ
jgi:peptidoglycan/LPS O-acetylase OafA/YrhL